MPVAKNDDKLLLKDNRGDWTPLELFTAGVRGWKAELRRQLDGDKSSEVCASRERRKA
jgi:hypothetical protein